MARQVGRLVLATSERSKIQGSDVDLLPTRDLVAAMLSIQQKALRAIEPAVPTIEAAIEMLVDRLRHGGRMVYAGAGSSGLMAQVDAIELPGTYGLPPATVPVILAGGPGALQAMQGAAEDDEAGGTAAVEELNIGPGDGLIAIAASGRTPFTLAVLDRARDRGALTIALACTPGSPLLQRADLPVLLPAPAEIVAGSTRMAAGTMQKCALNMISTGVAMRLGHAYRGLMVNMQVDNAKLRRRAVAIVAAATDLPGAAAEALLARCEGSIKTAIVVALQGIDPAAARRSLERGGGDLRATLAPVPAARPIHETIREI